MPTTPSTPMPAWPQQEEFRKAVNAYRKAHGLAAEEMAPLLDMKASTLRQHMYDRKKSPPSLKKLQTAAKLFGRPITHFIDDPGDSLSVPGLDATTLSPVKRAAAARILRTLGDPNLTDAQAITMASVMRELLQLGTTDAMNQPGDSED